MSERPTPQQEFPTADRLVIKPIMQMTLPEYKAWYKEYMKTVPEDNIMILSGQLIEVEDDPEKFDAFVERRQAEMVERGEV